MGGGTSFNLHFTIVDEHNVHQVSAATGKYVSNQTESKHSKKVFSPREKLQSNQGMMIHKCNFEIKTLMEFMVGAVAYHLKAI